MRAIKETKRRKEVNFCLLRKKIIGVFSNRAISAYREVRKWLMGQTIAWKWYITTKINVNKMFNNVGPYLYNNGLRGSIGGKCLNMSKWSKYINRSTASPGNPPIQSEVPTLCRKHCISLISANKAWGRKPFGKLPEIFEGLGNEYCKK